jgi:hypothetical protein
MAGGAADHRKIEHLPGKDGCGQHPHQGHFTFAQLPVHLAQSQDNHKDRKHPKYK